MATSRTARLGVMRLGRARLNYAQPWVRVFVNGVNRTNLGTGPGNGVRIEGASITDELNQAPNVVQLHCAGFTPVQGQAVKIYMGDVSLAHQLFGGHILSLTQRYEVDTPAKVAWDCSCIDYTWLLNRRTVIKKYTNQSATAIIQDLISSFTSGFTSAHVVAGLPTIDEITFTNEEVSDAITRVVERIGGYWFADYDQAIHAFVTNTETAGPITQAASRRMAHITQHVDLSQVATRVTARGGGSNAASDVEVGGTTIPVEDSSWYAGGGGVIESGPQRIPYTGVAGATGSGSTTGYITPPELTHITWAPGNGVVGGTNLTAGTYLIGITNITAAGESTINVLTPVTLTGAHNEVFGTVNSRPPDPNVTSCRIYISTNGGDASTLTLWSVTTPWSTLIALGFTEVKAGTGAAPPAVNLAGVASLPIAAGSTSLTVEDLSLFAAAGWAEVGGMVFRYTGRSATTGAGTLTGIPASGVGSLTAAVRSGTVKSVPHLTGCSGILYAINKGDPANVVVTVNDATAQTAMAAWIGSGDGIHEHIISDGRWSITEATARATAELTRRKNPLTTIAFESRDPTLVSGRDVTITLTSPAISGTFKIQRVALSEIGTTNPLIEPLMWPLRTVECSSIRYSFEDLLRQIRKVA